MAHQNVFHQRENSTMTSSINSSPFPSQSITTAPTSFIQPEVEQDVIIDDATYSFLKLFGAVILGLIVGVFGIITNIINLIVFTKQGLFSGGSVIGLFFLSIVDLGVAVTNCMYGAGIAVMDANIPNLPIEPTGFIYMAIGWPHQTFIFMNRLITAYIAFERCMCVVIPFKVKNIFAPRRALFYLLTILGYGILSHAPVYVVHRIGRTKVWGTNFTYTGLIFTSDRQLWYYLVYYINYFFLSFLSVLIVVICTAVTSVHIRISKQWRKKMSGTSGSASKNSDKTGNDENADVTKCVKVEATSEKVDKKENQMTKGSIDKEARLVKMIATISIIFFFCYIPEMALTILKSIDDRINAGGQYERFSNILNGFTSQFATINSSVNVFVYYRMSSKYKEVFDSYFGKNKGKS